MSDTIGRFDDVRPSTTVEPEKNIGVTETLTLHGALRELKTLSGRIQKAIDGTVIQVAVPQREVKSDTVAQTLANGKASLQSALDLIRRYDSIKSGIILSNATTPLTDELNREDPAKVEWEHIPITVAEAIEKRGEYLRFLTKLERTLTGTCADVLRRAENITDNAQKQATQMMHTAPSEKATEDELSVYNSYIDTNRGVVVTAEGVDIDKLLTSLRAEIDHITTAYDALLSVANATARIEISYPVGRLVL